MALAGTVNSVQEWGTHRVTLGTLAFDSSYPTGGEAFRPDMVGLTSVTQLLVLPSEGLVFELDDSTDKVLAYRADGGTTLTATVRTGAVTDDDSAAVNGTALYVVPMSNGVDAFFESTTAGNADTSFKVGSGGPTAFVNDNDTPGGVQVYYDEDAANADSRFLANTATGADQFVHLSDGTFLRVVYNATPATPGVAVYIDDDGASAHLRLLSVSPTNANGSYTTDDQVAPYTTSDSDAALVEVTAATNLAAWSTVPFIAIGH